MTINQHNLNRNIPSAIKQTVRKRCGFGCVICGNAIVHYEHFNPEFEFATEHSAGGITLLCPNHHEEKKKGLITNEQINDFNNTPNAINNGTATHQFVNQITPEIVIGQKTFAGGTSVIRVDDEVVLGFKAPEEDGAPFRLSFSFFDRTGVEIYSVIDNEIVCENQAYDIESTGHTWTARSKKGRIDLRIKFDLPTRITLERLNFRKLHWGLVVNGPQMDLTYDGGRIVSISGWAKMVGPCLFDLVENSPNVSIKDLEITYGRTRSPLGSKPDTSGDGYSIDWPIFALLDSSNRDPHIYKINNVEYVGLFLRSSDAHHSAKKNQIITPLNQVQCATLIRFMTASKNISKVSFNPEMTVYVECREVGDFISALGNPSDLGRNDDYFCGSKNRFKHCHGRTII